MKDSYKPPKGGSKGDNPKKVELEEFERLERVTALRLLIDDHEV